MDLTAPIFSVVADNTAFCPEVDVTETVNLTFYFANARRWVTVMRSDCSRVVK